jgi:hypothetical protein
MTRWKQASLGLGMVAIVVVFWAMGAANRSPGDTTTTLAAVGSTTSTEPPTATVETTITTPAPAPAVVPVGQPGTFVVTDFGAVPDSKNDNTAAFQSAVDAAAEAGGVVLVPSVGGRSAYVINGTISVPPGVSIVGSASGTGLAVEGPYPWPDTPITGAKILARPSPADSPLFRLGPGTTVRGLWITYDQQPMPSDSELVDGNGAYQYLSFDAVRSFFIDEHVVPTGPTFYIESGDQVKIQDIVADRYWDFLYMKEGGPLRVDSVSLYGYGTGFTVEESDAVNAFTNISFAPTVGPFVPGTGTGADEWTWVFGAIASQVDNVGFHFGRADAFVLDNIAFRGGNTAVRVGASFDYPIIDPLTETFFTNEPGLGPWGQIQDIRIEQAAVGIHLVWPSPVALTLSNVSMVSGIDDGSSFSTASGSGDTGDVSRQALILVESSFNADNNGVPPQVPAVLATNVALASRADTALFGQAAATVDDINGRVFLVNGDLGMEINGFSLGLPYSETLMIGAGDEADEVSIRIRGVLEAGIPVSDKLVERSGVSILAGEVLVIQAPPPPAPTTTTAAPADTTTTTVP